MSSNMSITITNSNDDDKKKKKSFFEKYGLIIYFSMVAVALVFCVIRYRTIQNGKTLGSGWGFLGAILFPPIYLFVIIVNALISKTDGLFNFKHISPRNSN